ncbi:MAG: type II toxin-antitoxin system Phd/YefM family antitoxin [Thermodesulfobacteriota bacterium]
MPEAVTFTQARRNWTALLDRVVDDHNPLIITRHKAKPVVVMALEDCRAIQERLKKPIRYICGDSMGR